MSLAVSGDPNTYCIHDFFTGVRKILGFCLGVCDTSLEIMAKSDGSHCSINPLSLTANVTHSLLFNVLALNLFLLCQSLGC